MNKKEVACIKTELIRKAMVRVMWSADDIKDYRAWDVPRLEAYAVDRIVHRMQFLKWLENWLGVKDINVVLQVQVIGLLSE